MMLLLGVLLPGQQTAPPGDATAAPRWASASLVSVGAAPVAVAAALPHGLAILGSAEPAAAGLFAAAMDLVHRRPRPALRFVLGDTSFFVTLLDMALLTFFLVRVFA